MFNRKTQVEQKKLSDRMVISSTLTYFTVTNFLTEMNGSKVNLVRGWLKDGLWHRGKGYTVHN